MGVPATIETEAERLSNIVKEVKTSLKRSVEEIIYVGALLLEAKELVGHGNWGTWLAENFSAEGLSESSAGRFMRVARFAEQNGVFNLKNLEPSAAYLISAKNAPAMAVDAVLDQLSAGATVTHADAQSAIDTAKKEQLVQYVEKHAPEPIKVRLAEGKLSPVQAHALTTKLEHVNDPELREHVVALGVSDPGVIDFLGKLKEKEPEAYQEVRATGFFQGTADPVPVASANEREARDFYKEVRSNTHVTDWESKYIVLLDAFARLFSVEVDPAFQDRFLVTFQVDRDSGSKIRDYMDEVGVEGVWTGKISGEVRFRRPAE